ncbi:Bug family tripartite tricarboxylate transporter substrate binding protein [Nocardiopsis oceani]
MAAAVSVAVLTACTGLVGQDAADYPQEDIEFLVGVSPGGDYDTWARILAPHLEEALPDNVTVIVDNVPGAGGLRAANTLAAAEPDGYVFGITNTMGLTAAYATGQTDFEVPDLTWLASISQEPMAVLVSPDAGYETIDDLAADGTPRAAITGMGASTGIGAALVANTYGFDWDAVTHDGGADASLSVVRGDSDFMIDSVFSRSGEIEAGDLVPILNLSDQTEGPGLADVESAAEQGEDELVGALRFSRDLAAPPDLPDEVHQTLTTALEEALASAELEEQVEEAALELSPLDSGEATAQVEEMVAIYEEVEHMLEIDE